MAYLKAKGFALIELMIVVAIVMAVVLGLFWIKGDKEQAKPVAIFFACWIVGAIAM